MSNQTPIPLLGRLALQLKYVNSDQLASAVEHASTAGAKLGEVMVEMGLVNAKQLKKLELVQRDVVAKHRARKAGTSAASSSQSTRSNVTPSPQPDASAVAEAPPPQRDVNATAARAAQDAAPMTSRDVAELELGGSDAPSTESPVELELNETPDPVAPTPEPPAISETAAADTDSVESPSAPAETASVESSPAPPVVAPTALGATAADGDVGLALSLPGSGAEHREQLETLLKAAVVAGASDVHFHAGGQIKWRLAGELVNQGDGPLSPETSAQLVAAALTSEEQATLERHGELDYCLDLPGIGRFRANSYRQQRGFDTVLRIVSAVPPTLEELGLSKDLARFTKYHQGMVLITGPAGCGKSATMAALVNLINESREEHILCIEDPIEILHPSKKCVVNQRHAGRHTESFARALRGALREDPDVIVIGELRDLETISLAMTAAETGHFVLATLHTNNAVRTINRMIGAFPSSEQGQIRTMLSESLRAVISQRLVPRADGQGRVPALELLVLNKAISNLVRDEKTVQIKSAIQTGKAHGMALLEQTLDDLVKDGTITRETALRYAEDDKLITQGA